MESLIVEHHHGLTFCFNLKYGLENGVSISRLKAFSDWFYFKYLKSHFNVEEKMLFPILGEDDSRVIQAIVEHRRIESLFLAKTRLKENLMILSTELDHHIKFEERHVFPEIIKVATQPQLELLEDVHDDAMLEDWDDKFWD